MIDQDDLLLLKHLRAHAIGNDEQRATSKDALALEPGRAAGRVAAWALERTVSHLQRFARRGWSLRRDLVPGAQEVRLAAMIRAIAERRLDDAREAALWLVPGQHAAALIDRASPLTMFYAGRTVERRAAAHA